MEVEPSQVAEQHAQGTIQLIDIREDYEWDAGRIAGARHLALGELTQQAETIDPEKPVVFASPTYATAPAGDASRVFVTERAGRVRVIRDGVVLAQPFLDVTSST